MRNMRAATKAEEPVVLWCNFALRTDPEMLFVVPTCRVVLYAAAGLGISPVLTSSLDDRAACVGENITLTCNTFETGKLTWIIGIDGFYHFTLLDMAPRRTFTGHIYANVTSYSQDEVFPLIGNLTSTRYIQVDPFLTDYPINIVCKDFTSIPVTSNIAIAGMVILMCP